MISCMSTFLIECDTNEPKLINDTIRFGTRAVTLVDEAEERHFIACRVNTCDHRRKIVIGLVVRQIHNESNRRIWRLTVRVWLWTPPTEHSTRMAPSKTRKARSTCVITTVGSDLVDHGTLMSMLHEEERHTSKVKSTWPGVSMMLML